MSVHWAIAGGSIATLGILSNSFSISYFISQEKSTLPGRQFILLNTLDLAMCTCSSFALTSHVIWDYDYDKNVILLYIMMVFVCFCQFLVEATAFATCVLSVSRCIKLWFPFYEIKAKLLIAFTAIFFSYLSVREATFFYLFHLNAQDSTHIGWTRFDSIVAYLVLGSMVAIMASVAVSNILCATLLISNKIAPTSNRGSTNTNIEATITIIIVSVLFLFFNMTNILTAWVEHVPEGLFVFGETLSIALNSALNPVVFFLRKRAMRQYFKKIFVGGERNMVHCAPINNNETIASNSI